MREIIARYSILVALGAFLSLLLSLNANAQACGLFGMIDDRHGNAYFGRFDETLSYVTLESAATCEVSEISIEILDVRRGRRQTKIHMMIQDPRFEDAIYVIKYPTGNWNLIRESVPDTARDRNSRMWIFQ